MPRKLSFYDHHRMSYHDTTWHRHQQFDGHIGEFLVGDYPREHGTVGPRGEITLQLYQLGHPHYSIEEGRNIYPVSVKVEVHMDALGTMRALDAMRVFDKIKRAHIETRDDLSRVLLGCGLRDMSHTKLPKETPAHA